MRKLRIAAIVGGAVVVLAGIALGGWSFRNLKSYDVGAWRIRHAGYTERQTMINNSTINYGRGPDNDGIPLLLIHGQGVAWEHYYRVLPALAEDYRVFAVDVYGHGGSARVPSKYTAAAIGADLARFIEQEIGEPVIVTGHSSGGQLAAWLAGHRPDLVRGVLLEDPPMFTTKLPRAKETWNWVNLATNCHRYLESGEHDWLAYSFAHERLWTFFGDAQERIIDSGLKQHARHPDQPITTFFMPPGWNDLQRMMADYDPRFGDAFYTDSWDTGFDHEATLRAIRAPATLIHANWSYGADGVLQGAMDDRDAERVASLIDDVEVVKVDSGHDVHGEHPDDFLTALDDLTERVGQQH